MGIEIVRYTPELTAALVDAINLSLAPLREVPRLNPEGPELGIYTHADLMRRFASGLIDPDCSFAAVYDGKPVAAAEMRVDTAQGVAGLGWVTTHPDYVGHGLARQCVAAGLLAARQRGATVARTLNIIDSRWEDACLFLERLGFEVLDAEHSNITMELDIASYVPHDPVLPEGYTITTQGEDGPQEWTRLKNIIFGGNATVDYFMTNFASRHDFDPNGWLFVEHDGVKVGMSAGMICRNRQTGEVTGGQVHFVGTTEEERGKGIGEAIVVASVNYLMALGADPIVLETQPFRIPAIRLYEKLGFVTRRAWRTYVKNLT